MQLYSTNHISPNVTFEKAVFKGLPDDNGLYWFSKIPNLSPEQIASFSKKSFTEIALEVSKLLLSDEISEADLKQIIDDAFNFDCPIIPISNDIYAVELFHGPTLAFKDFGARFMSRVMRHFLKKENQNTPKITKHKTPNTKIIVATSGDTGSAVAQGFYEVDGIDVIILYPKGKVSLLQEKQLTTLGKNITALEIDGTFDDCQRLVKSAFLDAKIQQKHTLSSANSINIARLVPQSFYYFYTYSRLAEKYKNIVFCTPSGNFGNLCGGLLAKQMGLPIHHFIAATNANNIVPVFLETGNFEPKPSIKTIANAMDVGNPSNFPRMLAMYETSTKTISTDIHGYAYTDNEIKETIQHIFKEKSYTLCPHSAVGYLGIVEDVKKHPIENTAYAFLSTAHPAKFIDEVEPLIEQEIVLPPVLKNILNKTKTAIPLSNSFETFKEWLLGLD